MRNEHPGLCYRCGKWCEAYQGHFERMDGGWLVQHADCAIKYRGTDQFAITSFSGDYRWLSNFHSPPVQFDGVLFPTVEHAYQAAKSEEPEVRRAFASLPSPGDAKRVGRTIRLRHDWDSVRLPTMALLLVQKFAVHTFHGNMLANTGENLIVEGNTWGDTFWGVCRGEGQNLLGQLIMGIREQNHKSARGHQCKCGRGYVSRHDGKCGYCRSRREQEQLNRRLSRQPNLNIEHYDPATNAPTGAS